ncbi:MAG: hypothetical protein AAF604_21410 [Acidobacteriota bacterium]
MGAYSVVNKSDQTIWWRDGAWTSGELPPGQSLRIESDHDANVSMFAKLPFDKNIEWGFLWISKDNGCCVVRGPWDWAIKAGLDQVQCSALP